MDGERHRVAVVRWSGQTSSDLSSLVGVAGLVALFAASLIVVFSASAGVVRDVAVVVAYVSGAGVLLLTFGGVIALVIMLVVRGDGISRRPTRRDDHVAVRRRAPRKDRRTKS